MFKETYIKVSDRITLNFLNIDTYSDKLIRLIKEEIIKIWDGDLSEDDLKLVKKQIKSFFENKDEEKKLAFVAEFICHLYLRYKGFNHYSVLKNLEEIKAPKKGFDGLYEKANLIWIVESKCALPTTITDHNTKVGLAYNDILNKIEKTSAKDNENNPWENARNHFFYTRKNNASLLKDIKKYRQHFIENKKLNIKNFNIIPCSTIYLDKKWDKINDSDLQIKLEKLLKKYKAKNINVLCVNKKSIDDFINFING